MKIERNYSPGAIKGSSWGLSPGSVLHSINSAVTSLHHKSRDISGCSSVKPTRMQVAIWGVLLVATIALSLKGFQSDQFETILDSPLYIILAQSLVYSDDYGLINAPGEPGAARYSFGYPLLLAPIVLLFPDDPDAMKIVPLIGTALNVTLLFWGWPWFSCRSYWWGLAIVGLYALSPLTIRFSRPVYSEAFFTAFCLVAILLAQQAAYGKQYRGWSLLMSIVLMFVIFMRTIGVTLMILVFTYLLFMRGREIWKTLAVILVQMIIIVVLIVGITSVELEDLLPTVYLTEMSEGLDRGVEKDYVQTRVEILLTRHPIWIVRQYIGVDLRRAVLPIGSQAEQILANIMGIPTPLGFLVFGLIILGYFRWLTKERLSIFNLFLAFYAGILVLWGWNGPRLYYPILPQLFFSFLLGVEATLFWTTPFLSRTSTLRLLRTGILATLVVVYMVGSGLGSFLLTSDPRLLASDLQERTSWLKSSTPSFVVIMTERPYIDFVYSGRKTVPYPTSFASASELKGYLVEHDIDYILIAPPIKRLSDYTHAYDTKTIHLLSLIENQALKDHIKLVYSSERELVKIFQIKTLE